MIIGTAKVLAVLTAVTKDTDTCLQCNKVKYKIISVSELLHDVAAFTSLSQHRTCICVIIYLH